MEAGSPVTSAELQQQFAALEGSLKRMFAAQRAVQQAPSMAGALPDAYARLVCHAFATQHDAALPSQVGTRYIGSAAFKAVQPCPVMPLCVDESAVLQRCARKF